MLSTKHKQRLRLQSAEGAAACYCKPFHVLKHAMSCSAKRANLLIKHSSSLLRGRLRREAPPIHCGGCSDQSIRLSTNPRKGKIMTFEKTMSPQRHAACPHVKYFAS
jgi:hypothetical protein